MACEPFRIGDISGFACTRGPRRRVALCQVPGCQRPHVKLCDQEPSQRRHNCRDANASPLRRKPAICACIACMRAVPGQQDRDLCPAHRKLHEQKASR